MSGGFGGGQQVGAEVVLSADTSQYNQQMSQSVQQTNALAEAYANLTAKIDRGLTSASKVSFGISAASIASITAATVAAGHLQEQMHGLDSQSRALGVTYGEQERRMKAYGAAVNEVRGHFGTATSAAAQLVQTISGFERAGSTGGLKKLATDFEYMSKTTGESSVALAQASLTLQQTMGTGLKTVKQYNDQLVTMASTANTSATSLATFTSQIAPLGRQLNMTQSELTGFAAAFSKAGQDGFRASNVFSQMTSDIAQSLRTNSPRLAAYANLLGVTTQRLKEMSGAQVSGGLFDAIGRKGAGSLQTLNSLGYDGLNVTRVVSAVTQQSGGVGNMIRQANGAWGNDSSHAAHETMGEQFSKLKQESMMAGEAIGEKFLPAMQSIMTLATKFASSVTSFMQGPGGDLVALFTAIAAPVAALAGGLLSLHNAILPLMTLLAIRRSAFGMGMAEGFKGNQALRNDPRMADRPWVARGYAMGAAPGALLGRGVRNPTARWILGMDKMAAAERAGTAAAGESAARGGFFARTTARGMEWTRRNLIVPQVEPLQQKDIFKRTQFFGKGKGAADMDGASASVQGFRASLAQAGITVKEWAVQQLKGSAASVRSAEADTADAAATTRHSKSVTASTTAVAENATANRAAARSITESARLFAVAGKQALVGTIKGGAGLAAGAAGVGVRGAAAAGRGLMGLAGGPMGLAIMGLMAMPFINKGLDKLFGHREGSQGPRPGDISGTGLSFPVSNVVAPIAEGNGSGDMFNPMAPTASQVYAAGQRADYVNQGVKKLKSAEQAATLYGPAWAKMAAGDKRILATDLMKRLGRGGYQQFIGMIESGDYDTFTGKDSRVMAGTNSGLSMLYNAQSQAGQGYSNQAGTDFRALRDTFLAAERKQSEKMPFHFLATPGPTREADARAGRGFTKGGVFSDNLGTKTVSSSKLGGFLPFGAKTSWGLTGEGMDFARQLYGGDPGRKTQSALGKILYNMPEGMTPEEELKYMLSRLPEKDLSAALQNHGLEPEGDRKKDVAKVMAAVKGPSKKLRGALEGLGLTETQQTELANLDASNPSYYGGMLARGGISQQQLADLAVNGGQSLFPGTLSAVNAYQANRMSMLSPFMTPQQMLLGSNSGRRGESGVNADMIPTFMGGFNGQFSLLGTAQGALMRGRGLADKGELSGNTEAMADLQSASNNLQSAYTSQLQTMKQYQMTMQQMDHSAQQFRQSMKWAAEDQKRQVKRSKEDYARGKDREEYNMVLSRKRSQEDFDRSRRRAEADFNLSRQRSLEDFTHQTKMMMKQAALSMMDIYTQTPAQGFTSAQFLLTNNAQQTANLSRQSSQLETLRGMGLTTNAIQQLGLTDAKNNQQLNGLFQQLMSNPQLIDQLNSGTQQRVDAAGALVTDKSSMSYEEQVYQFNLSLERSASDFARSMKRAGDDYNLQMTRQAKDFNRQMALQDSDFNRQLARQQREFNRSVSRSWTTFGQGVAQSMRQMNMAAEPLTKTAASLQEVAQKFKGTAIGDQAAALAKATPVVKDTLKNLADLLNPKTSAKQAEMLKTIESIFSLLTGRAPRRGNSQQGGNSPVPGGYGGPGGSGVTPTDFGTLPKPIATRMKNDHPKSGMCLRDVANVLNAAHGVPTAWASWKKSKGHRHGMSWIPVGAPVFWGPERGGGAGHVAIYAGNGMMWSEDTGDRWMKKKLWPGALGWSDTLNGTKVSPNYGMKGFAKGSWDLPQDMIAEIHKGEMIIPAKVAHQVRQALSAGQAKNLRTHSQPVVSHVDARSYQTTMTTTYTGDIINQGVQNPAEFSAAMKQQARLAALAKR